jgi:hypothetical protein
MVFPHEKGINSMLEITPVKSIAGTVELPPNPDFFLITLLVTLATGRVVRIDAVPETPLILLYREIFSRHLSIERTVTGYALAPAQNEVSSYILLPYKKLPYSELITFTLLALGKTVAFKDLPLKRLEIWKQKAALCNGTIAIRQFDDATGISFTSTSELVLPSEEKSIDTDDLQILLGIALGSGKRIGFMIDQHFQTPMRHLLPHFGYRITVKNTIEQKKLDPLLRRIRLMTSKVKKTSDQRVSFSVTIERDKTGSDPITITLPGDDILGALLLAAKSILQKGQLIISNVPLEPWCCATLAYIRKMGCVPGLQENRQTSFGAAGVVCLQKFKMVGRKIDCKPLFHYNRYLSMFVVLSTFSAGQSVFRHLEDLRNEEPDLIEEYLRIVRMLGGRHGEMPDGVVIDGAKQHDGFDCPETMPAALSGACAIAALRCSGKTTIEDARIIERWPDFKKLVDQISETNV